MSRGLSGDTFAKRHRVRSLRGDFHALDVRDSQLCFPGNLSNGNGSWVTCAKGSAAIDGGGSNGCGGVFFITLALIDDACQTGLTFHFTLMNMSPQMRHRWKGCKKYK